MSNRPELQIKERKDIRSGSFGVIETVTEITVPEGCVGVVAIRKRYGDKGIFLTSPFLWGPWKGCPVLSIWNGSPNLEEFIEGEPIAHVAFLKEIETEELQRGLHDHNYSGDRVGATKSPE